MSVYYFHCSDGRDLIIDRDGFDVRGARALARRARSVASDLMVSLPSYPDWSAWAVYVYDRRGQVEIMPFAEVSDAGCLAKAA